MEYRNAAVGISVLFMVIRSVNNLSVCWSRRVGVLTPNGQRLANSSPSCSRLVIDMLEQRNLNFNLIIESNLECHDVVWCEEYPSDSDAVKS